MCTSVIHTLLAGLTRRTPFLRWGRATWNLQASRYRGLHKNRTAFLRLKDIAHVSSNGTSHVLSTVCGNSESASAYTRDLQDQNKALPRPRPQASGTISKLTAIYRNSGIPAASWRRVSRHADKVLESPPQASWLICSTAWWDHLTCLHTILPNPPLRQFPQVWLDQCRDLSSWPMWWAVCLVWGRAGVQFLPHLVLEELLASKPARVHNAIWPHSQGSGPV